MVVHEAQAMPRHKPVSAGRAALRAIDKLLAERPRKVGQDFSEATRSVTAYRDQLIAIWRDSGSQADFDRLAAVNSVLSVVIGGHFPLGDVPWGHIEKARRQLADNLKRHH